MPLRPFYYLRIFSFRQNGRCNRAMMASNPMMPMAHGANARSENGCKPPTVVLLVRPVVAFQGSRSRWT